MDSTSSGRIKEGTLWSCWWTFGFHKRREIFLVSERLSADACSSEWLLSLILCST